jgi:hypothetical protein
MRSSRLVTTVLSTMMVVSGLAPAAYGQQPKDPRITIALFGENRVPNAQPWMRSTLAATFEDKLVQTKRFRVVSMLNKAMSTTNAQDGTDAVIDPSEAIRYGKQVQARYALILKQTRAQASEVRVMGLARRPVLEIAVQAQVLNTETKDQRDLGVGHLRNKGRNGDPPHWRTCESGRRRLRKAL